MNNNSKELFITSISKKLVIKINKNFRALQLQFKSA